MCRDWARILLADAHCLRRAEFTLPQGFMSATIVISGVGYHELFLNGNKVGQNKLDPGWTHYSKRYLCKRPPSTCHAHPLWSSLQSTVCHTRCHQTVE